MSKDMRKAKDSTSMLGKKKRHDNSKSKPLDCYFDIKRDPPQLPGIFVYYYGDMERKRINLANKSIEECLGIINKQYKPIKKINLVLDIDYTILESKNVDINEPYRELSMDEIKADIYVKGMPSRMVYKFRPYVIEFLKNIGKYCKNIFINTLATEDYTYNILHELQKRVPNLNIPLENICFRNSDLKNTKSLNDLKYFNEHEDEKRNVLIIDDNLTVWEHEKNISFKFIYSKKFNAYEKREDKFNEIFELGGYKIYNNLNKDNLISDGSYAKNESILINKAKEFCEFENSPVFQLKELQDFIINSVKLYTFSLDPTISFESVFYELKQNIFKCLVFSFIKYEQDINLINGLTAMIVSLGGKVNSESNYVTHYIFKKENSNSIEPKVSGKIYVTDQFIFDCFFCLKYLDENNYQ